MKKYDFEKMKQLVKDNAANGLVSIRVGMAEEWSWTAEKFWDKEEGFSGVLERGIVAGISGSSWATPIAILQFEDGSTIAKKCYIQDKNNATDEEIEEMKRWAKLTGGADSYK